MLGKYLQEIIDAETIMGQDLDPYSPVYGTLQAQQRNAKESVVMSRFNYKTELIKRTLLMIVQTNNSPEVMEHASELGTYTSSLDNALNAAVGAIDESSYLGKPFERQTLFDISSLIETASEQSGIDGFVITNGDIPNAVVSSSSVLTDYFANNIASSDQSLALFLIEMDKLTTQAISERFDQKVFPVLLTTKHRLLAQKLMENASSFLSTKPKLISDGGNIEGSVVLNGSDAESVKEALETIKKETQPQKRNKKQTVAETKTLSDEKE